MNGWAAQLNDLKNPPLAFQTQPVPPKNLQVIPVKVSIQIEQRKPQLLRSTQKNT